MLVAVADTHAIIWYILNDPRLSDRARHVFEDAAGSGDVVGISSISLAELLYLEEKNRVAAGVLDRLLDALHQPEPLLVEFSVDHTVTQAMREIPRMGVPDMPDRIIAATALVHRVPLLSRDRMIRSSDIETIW